jgi:hypothetical protein
MRITLTTSVLCLFPLWASATEKILCSLNDNGDETVMSVRGEPDALGGTWKDMSNFRVRALLAAPAKTKPWLLLEVYAEAADGDYRIISSQKVSAPFATGRMEVVDPRLGRSLRYECKDTE